MNHDLGDLYDIMFFLMSFKVIVGPKLFGS